MRGAACDAEAMPRALPSLGSLALLAALVVLLVTGLGEEDEPASEPARVTATVVRTVDGDTVEARIEDEVETVRYIGVDTPESVKPDTPVECYALRASHFNERLVEGERVRLDRVPLPHAAPDSITLHRISAFFRDCEADP